MTAAAPSEALHRLVTLSDQLLAVADAERRLCWANGPLAGRVGAGPGDLVGRPLADLVHPDDRPGLEDVVAGRGGELALRLRGPGDRWWPVRWRAAWSPDRRRLYGAGRVVGPAGDADATRADRQAALRALVARSPSSISVQDRAGRLLLVNDEWCRVHGATEEVVGTTRPLPAAPAPDPGSADVVDEEVDTVDGRRSYLLARFWMGQGEADALAEIGTDITERRRAELHADRRQRQLDALLATSPDIIGVLDATGRTRFVNPAEAAVLGYRHEDPAGVDMSRLVHEDDRRRVTAAFAALLAGRRPQFDIRYRLTGGDGRVYTVDSRVRALPGPGDTVAGAVVVTRNVTAQLEAEHRLRRALAAAELALRTKTEFLSRTSHELRTPLNAVLGFGQLLELDDLSDSQRVAVAHVLRAGRHLLELIDEVLDIARIETGHLALRADDVAVAEVVGEAVAGVRPLAAGAEVTVGTGDCGGLVARADRDRLGQVLRTVILEAVGRDGPGGRVVVAAHAPQPLTVRITVSDTRSRLGTGGFRAGAGAPGAGLSLCLHLVELMGGQLRTVGGPAGSTRVEIDLPAADSPAPAAEAPLRVLLVEPDLASLPLLEGLVQRRPGTVVLAAMQGSLAVDLARQHRPALVLADGELPDMAAGELARRLAHDPATAACRLVVLGGDRLGRPLDVPALLALLDEVRGQMARDRPAQ